MTICMWVNGVVLGTFAWCIAMRPSWWPLFAVLMVLAGYLLVASALAWRAAAPEQASVSTLTMSQSLPVGVRLMVGSGGGEELVRVIAVDGTGPFTLTVEATR